MQIPIWDSRGIPYDENVPEHRSRDWVIGRDGVKWMSNKWYPMVERGDVIMAEDGVSENMYNVYHTSNPSLGTFSERIYAFTLSDEEGPYWALDPDGKPEYGIECVCEITADLSNLRGGLVEKISREQGGKYWLLDYNVVIEFGDTELRAYLEWTENGETKRGQASLIPDSFM
ncbi:uncharacterized protein EI90DRAFT_2244419 [Cantharellus anzutake]|uniref:uncharacterized protein n=1 Tax=Cantharellus anzutake TaxID=1750568 RepID=UPI00190796EB|nr:uncharacterized protein EI90DRAFT_2244419 [Cantharellus anzutake]KAF8305225.1 hypothetical protein EI90DRAFT_2244419 [Cantharellus anzutake]